MSQATQSNVARAAALDAHLTLAQASRIAPGRPSTNCLWRWCRRGVLARNGERVRLEHIRAGGKIFTTVAWVTEFGRRLAEADAQYFDRDDDHASEPSPQLSLRSTERRTRVSQALQSQIAVEHALEEAGL